MSLDRGWGTVVCVASGPSFTVEQAEIIAAARAAERCRVIVVNDNWRRLPGADVLYGCDWSWWASVPSDKGYAIAGHDPLFMRGRRQVDAARDAFAGELWTQRQDDIIRTVPDRAKDHEQAAAHGLRFVPMVRGDALLSRDENIISCGSNGGFQVLMLARLFGARRVVLAGYDMQRTADKAHWFGDHPAGVANGNPRSFIKHFEAVASGLQAEGTEIVNCSPATALTCFVRADLAATLREKPCNP